MSTDARLEAVEGRLERIERALRGLRNWSVVAFLILLGLEIFIAWRIGL